MVLDCVIIVFLSAAAAVAWLMRASSIPSIYFILFDPWYPPRELMIFSSSCTSAALPGSAPVSLPRFSRHVACRPTCNRNHRTGPCCTRACKSYRQYLCWRSSALRHSQTLGFLGPVVPITGTVCSHPTAPTTLSNFRQGLGFPPARTP